MKRFLIACAALLIAIPAFATYVVVMKDGTRYKAKAKWTMNDGKAIVTLENGTVLALDPSMIDGRKTEEVNRLGLGDAKLIQTPDETAAQAKPKESSLGSIASLRQLPPKKTGDERQQTPATRSDARPVSPDGGSVPQDLISKYLQAYENVGFFDAKVESTSTKSLRVIVTADNEDQVFKAISATAFVTANAPNVLGRDLEMVELYMSTLTGASAGRFQMSAQDARAIVEKKIPWQQYYVRNVIF